MIRSTLRAASYLARDGVHDSLMIGGWAAGLFVGGLLDLIPAQALRVCAGRDYDRAVKMADALADAEVETEVLDPQWQMYGPGTFTIPETLNGRLPQEKAPAGERVAPGDTAPAGHPISTASAVVDPSPAIPPVGNDDPAAPSSPVPGAAGSTNLVDLIAEVLSTHGFSPPSPFDANVTCWCDHWRDSGRDLFQARTLHRKHVAEKVAERIEKASPPAPFTHGDLIEASQCVRDTAMHPAVHPSRSRELYELADRLADAGHANPAP